MEDVEEIEIFIDVQSKPKRPLEEQIHSQQILPTQYFSATACKQGSLVTLTQKFMALLKQSNGQINLNVVSNYLGVPKRRIYDITNVFEGIGLLQKSGPYHYWNGDLEPTLESKAEMEDLASLNVVLRSEEERLDELLNIMKKNVEIAYKDEESKPFAYVTRDDLRKVYPKDTVFTFQHDPEIEMVLYDKALSLFLDSGSILDVRLLTDIGRCLQHIESEDKTTDFIHVSKKRKMSTGSSSSQSDEEEDDEGIIYEKMISKPHTVGKRPPDDPNLEYSPLVHIHPPYYNFSLDDDEGLCELFDIQIDE